MNKSEKYLHSLTMKGDKDKNSPQDRPLRFRRGVEV
jgi:hypothetical protein